MEDIILTTAKINVVCIPGYTGCNYSVSKSLYSNFKSFWVNDLLRAKRLQTVQFDSRIHIVKVLWSYMFFWTKYEIFSFCRRRWVLIKQMSKWCKLYRQKKINGHLCTCGLDFTGTAGEIGKSFKIQLDWLICTAMQDLKIYLRYFYLNVKVQWVQFWVTLTSIGILP